MSSSFSTDSLAVDFPLVRSYDPKGGERRFYQAEEDQKPSKVHDVYVEEIAGAEINSARRPIVSNNEIEIQVF